MLDCLFLSDNAAYEPLLRAKLRVTLVKAGCAFKLDRVIHVDINRGPPDLIFFDRAAKGLNIANDQAEFLKRYSGFIMLSEFPIDVIERAKYPFVIGSVISKHCSPSIFDNAVLRAVSRCNAMSHQDSIMAHEEMISEMASFAFIGESSAHNHM